MDFSPDEKYVLTYSSREPSNPSEKAGLLVNFFEGSIDDYAVGAAATADGSLKWPIFKWASSQCASPFCMRIRSGPWW